MSVDQRDACCSRSPQLRVRASLQCEEENVIFWGQALCQNEGLNLGLEVKVWTKHEGVPLEEVEASGKEALLVLALQLHNT